MVRPVEQRDARWFATITALVAGVPVAIAMLALMWHEGGTNFLNPISELSPFNVTPPPAADVLLPYAAGVTRWPVLPLGIVLSVWLITRTPAAWFAFAFEHVPEERRRRAATLSYYTIAPLALLPLAIVCWVAAPMLEAMRFPSLAAAVVIGGAGSAIAILSVVMSWLNALRLLRQTTQASGLRVAATAAALPLTWAACIAVGTLVLPWVAGFVWLMIDSLRA